MTSDCLDHYFLLSYSSNAKMTTAQLMQTLQSCCATMFPSIQMMNSRSTEIDKTKIAVVYGKLQSADEIRFVKAMEQQKLIMPGQIKSAKSQPQLEQQWK